jgi:hypothetical protein
MTQDEAQPQPQCSHGKCIHAHHCLRQLAWQRQEPSLFGPVSTCYEPDGPVYYPLLLLEKPELEPAP